MQDSHEALFRIAATAFRASRVSEAEAHLRKLLAVSPSHAEGHFVLGMLLGRTGRWPESLPHLQAVVAASPHRDEALYWLALAKKNTGLPEEAAAICERALQINPRNPIVLNELGLCRLTINQADQAARAFHQATRSDPLTGVYQFNLGLALTRLDRIYKAKDAFQEAIRLEPNRIESYLELVRILEILDARQEVIEILEVAVERHPAEVQLITALAAARAYVGEKDEAEALYQSAMTAFPYSGNSFGLWLQQEGRFAESVDCFLTSLRAMPHQGVAYYGLAEAKQFEIDGQSWLDRAERLIDSSDLDLKGRTYLGFALARGFERQGDAAKTIHYFHRANELAYKLYNEGRPYDRDALTALNDHLMSENSVEHVNTPLDGHSSSNCPIFIVGMIRSGTTLLDQVISSHPQVSSAGEPVFWMREADQVRRLPNKNLSADEVRDIAKRYVQAIETVAGKSSRISDKMPLNYSHLGLIHRVFPNAKIIHLRRNPLDTCFSIYTTYLGQGPNFAYNASNIVFNYLEYMRVMDHWRSILPKSSMVEMDYESLILNREDTARNIFEFCDLEWSDACLHHEKNESSIRTPSKWQARQPIYKTSIQKWKPYENDLGDLLSLKNVMHPY